MNGFQIFVKRIMDYFVAILLLIFVGWIVFLGFVFACVSTRSWGVYTQNRVGKYEEDFTIFKLKTMKYVEDNDSSTTIEGDPRVTAVGGFLRKTKIDELPQIFNVLNGTMSLIGPRPTVKEDANRMTAEQKRRFTVSPGLTGLAQINGNTRLPWPKRIVYDLEYIDNYSLLLDLKIFVKTIMLILANKANSHPVSDDEWIDS